MPDLPQSIKQQFAVAEFPPDLVEPVVVAWTMFKELDKRDAPELLLQQQRRLLVQRLNRLQAWTENFP
jgi:hypothetical protein